MNSLIMSKGYGIDDPKGFLHERCQSKGDGREFSFLFLPASAGRIGREASFEPRGFSIFIAFQLAIVSLASGTGTARFSQKVPDIRGRFGLRQECLNLQHSPRSHEYIKIPFPPNTLQQRLTIHAPAKRTRTDEGEGNTRCTSLGYPRGFAGHQPTLKNTQGGGSIFYQLFVSGQWSNDPTLATPRCPYISMAGPDGNCFLPHPKHSVGRSTLFEL